MNLKLTPFFILILYIIFIGCEKESFKNSEIILARIDSTNITLKEFLEEVNSNAVSKIGWLKYSDDKVYLEFKNRMMKELIEKKVILEFAKINNITASKEEFDNFFQAKYPHGKDGSYEIKKDRIDGIYKSLKEELILKKAVNFGVLRFVEITEQEIKEYYENNIKLYKTQKHLWLSQIFVDNEEMAKKILKECSRGVSFSKLASAFSHGNEAKKGGDMGLVSANDLPEEVAKNAFRLRKGEISRVIKSKFGYHILLVRDVFDPKTISFEQIEKELKNHIREEKVRLKYEEWFQTLIAHKKLYINKELIQSI